MEFEEIYETTCPKDGTPVTHTILFKKRTCSRISDTIEYFSCSKEEACKECITEYP